MLDFGTGGLDLAYEVMRGYDALVLVDVSRQGGEPGTLYVIEPDPAEITPIEDGEVVSPHGMDPKTVLRFVKTVGGWPGKVVVVACEPADGRGDGPRALRRRSPARSSARPTWCSRRSTSCAPTPPTRRRALMHELSISSAIVDTALRHAGGRRVTRVDVQVGALRQVVPDSLEFYFEIVARDTACEGATLELELVAGLDALRGLRQRVGPGAAAARGPRGAELRRCRRSAAPPASAPDAEVVRGDELEVESIEVRRRRDRGGAACIAPR